MRSEPSRPHSFRAAGCFIAVVLCTAGCSDKTTAGPKAVPATAAEPRSNGSEPADPVARALAKRRFDNWYGVYMSGKKLGYARIEARPTRQGEPGAFVCNTEAVLVADGDEMRMTEARYYANTPPYALVEIRTSETTSNSAIERRYVASGNELTVHSTIDGDRQPARTISGTAETAASFLATSPDPDTVSIGDRASYTEFDLEEEADDSCVATVTDVRTAAIAGVKSRIAVLEQRVAGEQMVSEARIASGGVPLSESMGGMNLVMEQEAVARSKVEGYDMIADATAIDRDLGEPSDIEKLELVVAVGAQFRPPDAPNQRVTERPDGRFDVVIRSIPGAEATAAERSDALAVTEEVNWRAPGIAEKAAEVTAGATTDRDRVGKLIAWTYANLDKALTSNLGTATQVLERRAGDCTEHALLFTALARSLGIPTRRVGGVVYVGDDLHRFGWHAWNEVALDGKWVQVDPTWDEAVANATHLMLGVEGRDDSVMAMGNLAIEVTDVQ